MIDLLREGLNTHIQILLAAEQADAEAVLRRQQAEQKQRQLIKELTQEDIAYLRSSGVVDAFKEAASILRKKYQDTTLKIYGHIDSSSFIPPSIDLEWNSRLYSRRGNGGKLYQSDRVFGRAVRENTVGLGKEGQIIGVQFNLSSPVLIPQTEQFTQELLRVIEHPDANSGMRPPSYAKRVLARVLGPERVFNRLPH